MTIAHSGSASVYGSVARASAQAAARERSSHQSARPLNALRRWFASRDTRRVGVCVVPFLALGAVVHHRR